MFCNYMRDYVFQTWNKSSGDNIDFLSWHLNINILRLPVLNVVDIWFVV